MCTLSFNLHELPRYFESSESLIHQCKSIHPWIKMESFDVINGRRFKQTCRQRRRGRDRVCGRAPVTATVVSDASRAENFGYGRDLRSLTRWQWSVMVTGERPTIRRDASFGPSPAIISTVTYAHVVHVLAIYRLPRELRLSESQGKYVSLTEESHDAGEREPDASYVQSLRDAIEIPRPQFVCAGIPVDFIFFAFWRVPYSPPFFCFTFEILESF